MPRLSVVVPVFNAAAYLPISVPALLDQDFPREDFEIVFVDNNSTDGSLALLQGWSGITVLCEPEQGAYAARNLGVRASKGDVLVFTDPDCVPCRNWLLNMARAIESGSQVALGARRFASESARLAALADYEAAKDCWMAESGNREVTYGYANNLAVTREAFVACGPFDLLPRGADTLLVRRIAARYGAGALSFQSSAAVRHLEIDSVRKYFAKVRTYSESRRRNRDHPTARPLTPRERLLVWRSAAARNRYGIPMRALSLGLLTFGSAVWRFAGARPNSDAL